MSFLNIFLILLKKMQLMYKNLHLSYLQLANDVFGDEDNIILLKNIFSLSSLINKIFADFISIIFLLKLLFKYSGL